MSRNQSICEQYQSGTKLSELMIEFGLSKGRLSTILKKNGVTTRFRTGLSDSEILAAYSDTSANKAAIALGCSRKTVDAVVKRAGLAKPIRQLIATYQINSNYFDVINTEEKAYWFGFLLADGCLANRKYKPSVKYPNGRSTRIFQIGLSSKDNGHLEKLRIALGSSHPITRQTQIYQGRTTESVRLSIMCAELTRGLLSNGWDEFKAAGKWPTVVSDLERHLVRGLIDGDGWVSKSVRHQILTPEIGLCSEYQGPLFESLRVLGITATLLEAKSKLSIKSIWKWRRQGKVCKQIYHILYNDATIWLDRKRHYLESML